MLKLLVEVRIILKTALTFFSVERTFQFGLKQVVKYHLQGFHDAVSNRGLLGCDTV
jgi:hypothetical protein